MSSSDRRIVLNPVEDDPRVIVLAEQLESLASDFGLSLPKSVYDACVRHLLYVDQVNQYINLTRITDLDQALVLHILDSLSLLPYLPDSAHSCLDMGTGPGYPGIPLALSTELNVTMIDSVRKKVNAVNEFIKVLGITNAICRHDSIEVFSQSHRAEFDLVVARALASLPILLEYARPLLHKGGSLLVSKGSPSEDEMSSGLTATRMLGYDLDLSYEFDLPDSLGHRHILRFVVSSSSRVKLPRQAGMARKKPLA